MNFSVMRFDRYFLIILTLAVVFSCDSESAADSATGQGGSMTRFAISGNYLYLADSSSLKVYNLAQENFEFVKEVYGIFLAETLFAKGDFLYIGSADAMHIYSIAEPETPAFVFRYDHIVSCDPVVVQGNRAYITMRSTESFCNRNINALDIVDISEPTSPQLVKSYVMSSPYGLAVDGSLLFVCEGNHGLRVFDITNEMNIQLVTSRDNLFAYDVILSNGVATVTGDDGIFQFSYNNTGVLTLLSKIPVTSADV